MLVCTRGVSVYVQDFTRKTVGNYQAVYYEHYNKIQCVISLLTTIYKYKLYPYWLHIEYKLYPYWLHIEYKLYPYWLHIELIISLLKYVGVIEFLEELDFLQFLYSSHSLVQL